MFNKGEIVRRSELHDKFGGSRQGGIANCARYPYIFIFSSHSGKGHGYDDGWDEDGNFCYTGEGQLGDMKFTKGNLALRDHIKNQKRVFLFTFYKKGAWKYITELELFKDPFEFKTIDKNNDYRKGIKFVFKSLTPISYLNQESQINILEEYTTKYQPIRNKPNETERNGLVNSRVGQGWYRLNILSRWDNKCAVTGCNIPNILIASHIVPWNQATDEERLDIENGILLAPHIDALFDKHLISFNDDGKIIISHRIIPELHSILCINSEMKIYDLSEKNKEYLKRHREVFHSNNSIENRQ